MSKEVDDILKDRQTTHGDAEDNFERIGKMWGVILGLEGAIPPWKVALMMDSFKTVRCLANPNHRDNWLDKQGYTDLGMRAWFSGS